jgi:hypothetical protein
MRKETFYFSHDSNASRDPKILQMCSVYKAEGYGWYWMLIEMMREQQDYKLPISGKYTLNAIALPMYADAMRLQCYINDCVNEFQLFQKDDHFLWSESLVRRMSLMEERAEKARKSAMTRWSNQNQNNANAKRTQSKRNANASKSDAIKENKVKENKDIYGELKNVMLTPEEYQKLLTRFNGDTEKRINKLSTYIASMGDKYKSHYATILSWAQKDPPKIEQTTPRYKYVN